MSEEEKLKYWDIIEPIWQDAELYSDEASVYLKRFADLSEPQKVILPTHLICSEILNGGFHQCFWNGTGMFAPEAVVGFHVLGMKETATVVQKAMSVFGETFPRDRKTRCNYLESIEKKDPDGWNPFKLLDDGFYDSIAPEDGASWENDRYVLALERYSKQYLS